MAHFRHDLGEEDGEGRVGEVGEEEDGCGDPGDGIAEDGEEVTAFDSGSWLLRRRGFFGPESQAGDFLLARGEV